ncbi:MAG: transposase [Spirochaetales bacterium]|nr:transposase [Spirochaetales bacterium]
MSQGSGKGGASFLPRQCPTENRNGLIVGCTLVRATGTAEREAAIEMLKTERKRNPLKRITVGADKGYDVRSYVDFCRSIAITPHVAARKKGSAIDNRTIRSIGYKMSQVRRKMVEEPFGWVKTIGNFRRSRFFCLARTGFAFYIVHGSI